MISRCARAIASSCVGRLPKVLVKRLLQFGNVSGSIGNDVCCPAFNGGSLFNDDSDGGLCLPLASCRDNCVKLHNSRFELTELGINDSFSCDCLCSHFGFKFLAASSEAIVVHSGLSIKDSVVFNCLASEFIQSSLQT